MSTLNAVRLSAKVKPTAAVIVFHGLGDTGSGWRFLADLARRSPEFDHINFVFPNAPTIPITMNGGYKMPGWFDILALGGGPENQDVLGYTKALKSVSEYVDEQNTEFEIPSERIIVGGFSQGGGLALGHLVSTDKKIAGLLAFSPFVPFHDTLKEVVKDKNNNIVNIDTPVFHGHGEDDTMIYKTQSDANAKFFKETIGFKDYTYKTYPNTQHAVATDEILYALTFIGNILPKSI